MHDRQPESETFPKILDLGQFKNPLVLAPHPDDEVIGCGGLIASWTQIKVETCVVVLSDGSQQASRSERQMESSRAAGILGHRLIFWQLEDRRLRVTQSFIDSLASLIHEGNFDAVLTPALSEPHPDHQAVTLALMCALSATQRMPDLLLYESGGTLSLPNRIIDITAVYPLKQAAMASYQTQEAFQPYQKRSLARDAFRAITLGPRAEYAETFHYLPLSQAGYGALLPGFEPLLLRSRMQANHPNSYPKVSVLIRTIGDPRCLDALASVAAQSYSRIEVIVVAASESAKTFLGDHPTLPFPFRIIYPTEIAGNAEKPLQAMSRPVAANIALDHAQGDLLIFLDDDDFILPNHIQKLVEALHNDPQTLACHSDVQVVDESGTELLRYDRPCQKTRMLAANMLPIHAVMFRRELVIRHQCRFDESLSVMEDWDFWLQVLQVTSIKHVPGVSAVYRYQDRSKLFDAHSAHHRSTWLERIRQKWLASKDIEFLIEMIGWHAEQLDAEEQKGLLRRAESRNLGKLLRENHEQLESLRQQLNTTENAKDQAERIAYDYLEQIQAAQQRLRDTEIAKDRAEALAFERLDQLHAMQDKLENAESARRGSAAQLNKLQKSFLYKTFRSFRFFSRH